MTEPHERVESRKVNCIRCGKEHYVNDLMVDQQQCFRCILNKWEDQRVIADLTTS